MKDILNGNELEQVNGGKSGLIYFEYQFKSGDNLAVLAQKYGTTVADLCKINNLSNPDSIKPGTIILLPRHYY